jgi:hypothetical protein
MDVAICEFIPLVTFSDLTDLSDVDLNAGLGPVPMDSFITTVTTYVCGSLSLTFPPLYYLVPL